jgi:glycine cleavage system transcriptional repressor
MPARRTVLTAIGHDRPGLVEEVTAFVLERGGSIEESRMANLLGRFAIAMLVTGDAAAVERITADVEQLTALTGVDARFTPVDDPRAGEPKQTYRLLAEAFDQPGLVHEVADVFRRHGVNIETLDTTLRSAPETGAPLFAIDAVVAVPGDTLDPVLEQDLDSACEAMNISWTLTKEDR